jgi:DNA-binding GntR family transcriptional regulator
MSLDPNDGRKPTIQVAEAIRRDIAAGILARGDKLLSAPDLAVKYGVGKQTVTNAVKLLQDAELLVTRVGAGTFVRTDIDEARLTQVIGDNEAGTLARIEALMQGLEERITALEKRVK